jgi:hypothetical protein
LIYGHERHGADSAQLAASGTQLRTADGGVKRIYSELICSEIHGWHTARKTAARATIPNLDALDPKELKALIVSRHELIVSRDSEIKQLKLLIAKLRRMLFRRSSEKLDRNIEQLELRLEALQQNDAEKVAALPVAMANTEPAVRPARRPLPAHPPREVQTYLAKQEACPDCGGKLNLWDAPP